MQRNQLLEQINKVFIEILDNDQIELSEQTVSDDIAEWDSLAHIQLVVAIEKYFSIRFTSKEIQSWKNVGEMINCIQSK